jgi:hypothetical protein
LREDVAIQSAVVVEVWILHKRNDVIVTRLNVPYQRLADLPAP